MSLTRRLLLGLGVVLLLGTVAPTPARAAAPSVSVATATPAVGDWLRIEVSGFTPGPVQLQLCSADGAEDSSTACDLAGAGQVAVAEDGTGSGLIQVAQPPKPCPCLVLASGLQTSERAEAPVELGAGGQDDDGPGPVAGSSATTGPPADGQLVLAGRFDRPGDLGSVLGRFFGWETVLRLQVGAQNLGEVGISGGTAEIWASSTDRPTPRLVGQLEVPALPAGDRGSVQTDVVLPGPVLTGTTIWLRPYAVGPAQTVTTVVTERSWGLIAVAAAVLALVMVLAGRIGYALVSAVVNRKKPRRAPVRTGWRPTLVGVAAALAAVAVAVLVTAISEDRAAAAHWQARRVDAVLDAGALPSTPTITLPGVHGESDWRIQAGIGPASLTTGVGRWPGPESAPLLVGVGDQPSAPFARIAALQRGQVIVLRAADGTTSTYQVNTIEHPVAGTPVGPGGTGGLTLWAVRSVPGGGLDTVVRAQVVG